MFAKRVVRSTVTKMAEEVSQRGRVLELLLELREKLDNDVCRRLQTLETKQQELSTQISTLQRQEPAANARPSVASACYGNSDMRSAWLFELQTYSQIAEDDEDVHSLLTGGHRSDFCE